MVYEFTQSKVMRWFISIVVVVFSIYTDLDFRKNETPIVVFHTFSELKAAVYPYLFQQ